MDKPYMHNLDEWPKLGNIFGDSMGHLPAKYEWLVAFHWAHESQNSENQTWTDKALMLETLNIT